MLRRSSIVYSAPTSAYETRMSEVTAPRVWLMHGARVGDNAQVSALGDALGWPAEVKKVAYNERYIEGFAALGAGLESVDRANSDPLEPPWPDLVIAIGRRSVPVVQWIRQQSGGRARLVHLGRPRTDLGLFDLVITTPQYGLPARDNVLHLSAPLARLDPKRLAEAAVRWTPRLAHLPRPWTALIVGGDSFPYYLDAATAANIARQVNAEARAAGGAVLLTTSPRTAPEAADSMIAAIDAPGFMHRFVPGADNPYLAFLALADRLVVTGESVSMLTEAVLTGKPVEMAILPAHPPRKKQSPKNKALQWLGLRRIRRRHESRPLDRIDRMYEWLVERGEARPPRDIAYFHSMLVARGLARRFGQPGILPSAPRVELDELAQAVARVRALFSSRP